MAYWGAASEGALMAWTRKLPAPINLKDGRTIATLADARDVMLSLPGIDQRSEHWLYAGALLPEAATFNGPMGVTLSQLTHALRTVGLF